MADVEEIANVRFTDEELAETIDEDAKEELDMLELEDEFESPVADVEEIANVWFTDEELTETIDEDAKEELDILELEDELELERRVDSGLDFEAAVPILYLRDPTD